MALLLGWIISQTCSFFALTAVKMWFYICKYCQIMLQTKMPRSVWINQRLSHVLLSCLYSIFLSAVSFTVLVFVHVMIHSHCDGLCIYKKKCGICLWLHLFLFGWPHPEGVSVNLCRLVLFIPGRKKNKTKLCLNYGMLFQTEQRRHRQHDCDVPSCMCKDRLAVKQLLQSGDTRPCLPSSLSNY